MQSKGRIALTAPAGIMRVGVMGIGIMGIGLGVGATRAAAQQIAPAAEFTRTVKPETVPDSQIERITGELRGSIGQWTGVRSCSQASRATDARQAAYERWIGQQTLARQGKTLLVAGVGPARWRSENRRVDGRRSCKGWYETAPAYAHFY